MEDDAFAQAVALLTEYGRGGVAQVIIDGIKRVPPGRRDLFRQWEAIAEHVDEIALATRH